MNKDKIIRKSETFSEIISKKQFVKNKYFSIYYQKADNTLYGISVPKKVGKAHTRNKLKRQLKNIIVSNEKNIQSNINYVIIIKEATLELSYGNIENELLNLFQKVRI